MKIKNLTILFMEAGVKSSLANDVRKNTVW